LFPLVVLLLQASLVVHPIAKTGYITRNVAVTVGGVILLYLIEALDPAIFTCYTEWELDIFQNFNLIE